VAAFVESDRSEVGVVPRVAGAAGDAVDAERLGWCLAEGESVSAVALAEAVFEKVGAECVAEGDAADA
jgi:hypothetical protein